MKMMDRFVSGNRFEEVYRNNLLNSVLESFQKLSWKKREGKQQRKNEPILI